MPDGASFAAALADPSRLADDRARDAARHTAATLAFRGQTSQFMLRFRKPG